MKFGFDWPSGLIGQAVSEEKIFEIVNDGQRTTDDGRSMGIL